MRFMILRKADESTEAGGHTGQDAATMSAAMARYGDELQASGLRCAGQMLHSSEGALRLHFHDGDIRVSEGPFPGEKELVAGFTMLEAASQQEAIAWLKRWPAGDADLTLELRGSGCPGGLECINLTQDTADGHQQHLKRFLVLLKASPLAETGAIPSDVVLAAMAKRNEEGTRAGLLVAGEGLQTTASGKRVKFSNGKATVLDGPFSETKELIAGYWLLQSKSIADAVDWVRNYPYPFIDDAMVEIRQVQEDAGLAAAFLPGIAHAESLHS
ncbi:YciI family protein [Undibacterium sp. TJN25]|uniref:YciI family protein n=1 Tax=Undibacterium sp. TJN25 TaxID=3413056 RepID=UPI003BF27AA4